MVRSIIENIVRFILLILLQVLVINNLQLHPLCNPYIYILFVLALPLETPRWADVALAFVIGLFIDSFSDTLGMHCFACTLIGYLRFFIVKMFVNEEDRASGTPSAAQFGPVNYMKYVAVLVLIHHTVLFTLEAFSFVHFGWLVLRILTSTIVSTLLILSATFLEKRRQ